MRVLMRQMSLLFGEYAAIKGRDVAVTLGQLDSMIAERNPPSKQMFLCLSELRCLKVLMMV